MLYHACRPAWIWPSSTGADYPLPRNSTQEGELAEDLIFNRRPDALQRLIEHFEHAGNASYAKTDAQKVALQEMTPEERLHWRILHRQKDGVEEDIDLIIHRKQGLSRHEVAIRILNNVLLPAMKEVGDKFGSGELILPFVLQSAEVMKKSVSLPGKLPGKTGRHHKGTIVLAHGNMATCTTSARIWSKPSFPTTATRSSTWASRCRRVDHLQGG